MPSTEVDPPSQTPVAADTFQGRSVFLVETTAAGISVQTALLTTDNQLLRAPAVFPDIEYAFSHIDELKRLVSRHFSEAARVGAQVVAAQQASQLKASSTGPEAAPTAAAPEPVTAQVAEPVAPPRSSKAKK